MNKSSERNSSPDLFQGRHKRDSPVTQELICEGGTVAMSLRWKSKLPNWGGGTRMRWVLPRTSMAPEGEQTKEGREKGASSNPGDTLQLLGTNNVNRQQQTQLLSASPAYVPFVLNTPHTVGTNVTTEPAQSSPVLFLKNPRTQVETLNTPLKSNTGGPLTSHPHPRAKGPGLDQNLSTRDPSRSKGAAVQEIQC